MDHAEQPVHPIHLISWKRVFAGALAMIALVTVVFAVGASVETALVVRWAIDGALFTALVLGALAHILLARPQTELFMRFFSWAFGVCLGSILVGPLVLGPTGLLPHS